MVVWTRVLAVGNGEVDRHILSHNEGLTLSIDYAKRSDTEW